ANFRDLAATDQKLGAGLMPRHVDENHRVRTGRTRQLLEFLRVFTRFGVLAIQVNQNGPFSAIRAFEEQDYPLLRHCPVRPIRTRQRWASAPDDSAQQWKWRVYRPFG